LKKSWRTALCWLESTMNQTDFVNLKIVSVPHRTAC
jgi:hypothetical protein